MKRDPKRIRDPEYATSKAMMMEHASVYANTLLRGEAARRDTKLGVLLSRGRTAQHQRDIEQQWAPIVALHGSGYRFGIKPGSLKFVEETDWKQHVVDAIEEAIVDTPEFLGSIIRESILGIANPDYRVVKRGGVSMRPRGRQR